MAPRNIEYREKIKEKREKREHIKFPCGNLLADPRGFEPLLTVLETAVLPLTPWIFDNLEFTI